MKTPRVSPATPAPATPTPGAEVVPGDIRITVGITGNSIIVEAFDLEGTPQIKTEIGLAYYDQAKVDQFAASWRELMAKRCRFQTPPKLGLVP